MHPYYYGGYGLGFGVIGFIVHIAIIIAVIWVVLSVLRGLGMGRGHRRWMWHAHSALSILNERFAKGEIDQKEYEERKKVLLGEHTK